MSNQDKIKDGYAVLVDDNFDYMDESERHCVGIFEKYEEALETARRITRKSVAANRGNTAEETYEKYTSFGDDAFIRPVGNAPVPEQMYSAWTEAKQIAKELHGEIGDL